MDHESNLQPCDPQWTDIESRLRAVRPAPCAASLEAVLAEVAMAGPMVALGSSSIRPAPTRWVGFATGVCSGALAASLVWMLSLGWTREASLPPTSHSGNGSQSQAQDSPPPVQSIASSPQPISPAVVPVPSPRSSFSALDRWTSDPLRESLNPIAKQQWDQRRLEEHSRWGSHRTIASTQRPNVSPIPSRVHSLWGMRRGEMGDASW